MLSFLQKTFINCKTERKPILAKNLEFAAPKDIMRFGAKVFVISPGS